MTYSLCFVLSIFVASVIAAEDAACVIGDTECPCAIKPQSGTCMRHQEGNKCLLGKCSNGYKCDCMGFETCNISSCAIFTTGADAVPSVDTPFDCHKTPGAGTCITFNMMRDTVSAADSAKNEATASVKEADEAMKNAHDDLQAVQNAKTNVRSQLDEVDTFGEQVTEEERKDIENEAEVIVQAIADVQEEAAAILSGATEAFDANIKSGYYQRISRRKEAQAVQKEEEEKVEAVKPENKVKCAKCDELKAHIIKLRRERKEAAILAGTWAKKARGAKEKSRHHRENVKKIKLSAEEARARCVARSQRILARLRSAAASA